MYPSKKLDDRVKMLIVLIFWVGVVMVNMLLTEEQRKLVAEHVWLAIRISSHRLKGHSRIVRELAYDAAIDALIRASRKYNTQHESNASFATFARIVIEKHIITFFQRLKVPKERQMIVSSDVNENNFWALIPDKSKVELNSFDYACLMQAFSCLPPYAQLLLRLKYWSGWTFFAIAKALGKSQTGIWLRIKVFEKQLTSLMRCKGYG